MLSFDFEYLSGLSEYLFLSEEEISSDSACTDSSEEDAISNCLQGLQSLEQVVQKNYPGLDSEDGAGSKDDSGRQDEWAGHSGVHAENKTSTEYNWIVCIVKKLQQLVSL